MSSPPIKLAYMTTERKASLKEEKKKLHGDASVLAKTTQASLGCENARDTQKALFAGVRAKQGTFSVWIWCEQAHKLHIFVV